MRNKNRFKPVYEEENKQYVNQTGHKGLLLLIPDKLYLRNKNRFKPVYEEENKQYVNQTGHKGLLLLIPDRFERSTPFQHLLTIC